ncbi:DUF4245 domain-containing protein [Pseudonocardia bannensis]|uniref:DUF4245 domain-containing protein n=1 Tax=Pseudonocardia bannensis TaxID=630973 RepID=A0A848DG60_9PSEU|nr:DUF4245 domain-containing protein [Pseudonocardia bannensis]NMH91539.1 DUF4245 domain-containing protein [Pseudonocardia bannensis]
MSSTPDPQHDPATGAQPSDEPRPTSPTTTPPPPTKPARSALSMRDMLIALAVLVPIVLVMAGSVRSCSFSPGGPMVSSEAGPTVDAAARLRDFARDVPFAVRVPAVPPGWRANSTDRSVIEGGARIVRVGWITAEGRYLRLVQSDAAEEALVATEAGVPLPGRGTVDAGGRSWVEYDADGTEPFRVTEIATPGQPTVRLLITGSGTEDEFRALATATLTGDQLPVGTIPN